MKRIVFCSDTSCTILGELNYEKLGEVDGGVWVAIENSLLMTVVTKCIPITLLFFSELEMSYSLDGLNSEQVSNTISEICRSSAEEEWQTQALSEFQDKVMLGLNIISDSQPYLSSDEKIFFKKYSYKLVFLWTQFGYSETYLKKYNSAQQKIDELLSLKSEMIFESEDALKQLKYTEHLNARLLNESIFNYNVGASRKLGEIIKNKFDEKHNIELRYFTDLTRAMYVIPRDEALENYLEDDGQIVKPWKAGFISQISMRFQSKLQKQGKKTQTVYIDPNEFLYDALNLTHDEFEVAINEQIKTIKINPIEIWSPYLNSKQLNIIWHMAITSDMFNLLYPEIAEEFYEQLTNDIDHLVANLSKYPAWLDNIKIDSRQTALKGLIQNEKNIIADSEYFSAIASCKKDEKNYESFNRIHIDRTESIIQLEELLNNKI